MLGSFLRRLEGVAGGIEALVHRISFEEAVLDCQTLSEEALAKVFRHEALALRVKRFITPEHARDAACHVQAAETVANWTVRAGKAEAEQSEVLAAGKVVPFSVAIGHGAVDVEKYFQGVIPEIRRWRQVGSCRTLCMGPVDKLRLELDESWHNGCRLAREKRSGRPFLPAIARLMKPNVRYNPERWTRGFAHVDELAVMTETRGLFSANIYLQNAPSGGEVEIWPISFRNRWDFYRNAATLSLALSQDASAQALLRQKLPEPHVIEVEPGDLVILCTQRPHAVRGPILGGTRISLQGFISHEKSKSLKLEV